MRALNLAVLLIVAATSARALESTPAPPGACRCEGCGCKGGPGYRDQKGRCVSWNDIAKVCGEPPETECSVEKAEMVCDRGGKPKAKPKP